MLSQWSAPQEGIHPPLAGGSELLFSSTLGIDFSTITDCICSFSLKHMYFNIGDVTELSLIVSING